MADSLKTLALDLIEMAPDNLREDVGDLDELKRSIEFIGLIEPIRVAKAGDTYRIIAGHRRFRAIEELGWTEVKAIVQSGKVSDSDRTAAMLIENMQRVDLAVAEEAEGVRRLMQEHAFTQKQVAESLGVSTEWVKDRVSILNVDDVFFEQEKQLPTKHLALLGELTEDRRARLAKKIEEQPGSVGQYQVEEAINKQRSEERGERDLRKLRKAGNLATTEKEIKRLMKAELADTDGLDQAIKLKLGPAEELVTSYWEKKDVPFIRLYPLHGKVEEWSKTLDKNEIVILRKEGGYVKWYRAEVEVPGGEDEVDEDDEISRVVARNEELRAEHADACRAAEIAWVNDTKPAELISLTLRNMVQQMETGFQSFARLAEVLDRLGLEPTPFDRSADVEAQREGHANNVSILNEYAFKNNGNLARAVATIEIVTAFGNPYGIELPAEPEYEAFPEDEEVAF